MNRAEAKKVLVRNNKLRKLRKKLVNRRFSGVPFGSDEWQSINKKIALIDAEIEESRVNKISAIRVYLGVI